MEEERNNIEKTIESTIINITNKTVSDVLTKYTLKNNNIFIFQSGIGQNNAIIACSHLVHKLGCKKIYNIGTCGCLKHDNNIKIGDIITFKNNVIDYGFKLHPEKYKYDEANISDMSSSAILLTLNEYGTKNIIEDELLKHKFSNIFLDMESYGISAFCSRNNIDFNIVKIVSDFCNEEDFDANVVNYDIYQNLKKYISENIIRSLVF